MKKGFKICFVGNLITLKYSPDHVGIIQAFKKMKLDYFIADPIQQGENMVKYITKNKPDIIIHGMTDSLTNVWPQKIKEVLPNAIQVMSMWDYRPRNLDYDGLWSKWKLSGDSLNLITLSNKGQMKWWKESFNTDVMYWPHGCVVKDIETDDKYDFDTVFVGGRSEFGPYNNRVKLIDAINNGTKVEWINEGGTDASENRMKIWKDLGKIYATAKTVLDVSHFWDELGYASGRYFYSAGLGACSITKRFPGCEELYPEGTKIYFNTPEEAIDKIKFYVSNKKERDKVKNRGKEWSDKYHNYTVRFLQLFKKLKL